MLGPVVLALTGFLARLILGVTLRNRSLGCFSLILIPVGACIYFSWWQGQHPDALRSTSGLDFVFVPFPPLIGALAGYSLIAFIKEWRA